MSGIGRSRGRAFICEKGMASETESSSSSSDSGAGAGVSASKFFHKKPNLLITKPAHVKETGGSGGQEINLYANYFRILAPKSAKIYQYHVDFEPIVESTIVRRGLIHQKSELFGDAYVFDGMSNIKTCADLDSPIDFTVTRNSDGANITVTLKQVGEVSFGSFEMLRFYNTQMRRNLAHIGLHLIGRHYYEEKPASRLPDHGGLTIFRGFLTAVHTHDAGILSVVDTIFKFVRTDTLYTALREMIGKSPDWKAKAKSAFANQIVLTRHNNRTYRIDYVDFSKSPKSTFDRGDSQTISFIDYYYQQYQLIIKDKEQPLVVATSTDRDRRTGDKAKPVILIPELCNLTGLNDRMRADHKFMQLIASTTKQAPLRRIEQLRNFIGTVNSNETVREEIGRWGMSIEGSLVKVTGRFMGDENLILDKGGDKIINAEWNRQLREQKLYKPVSFSRWALLFMKRDEKIANEFRSNLIRVAAPMGIDMENPKGFLVDQDQITLFMGAIGRVPKEAELIVILVPNNNKPRYDSIKKYLCTTMPIPSQVVTTRVLSKKGGMLSVCTKIAIQIACKAGAEPWTLDIPPKKLMIAGYDTYHDSSIKGRSAGAFVSSTNQTMSKYFSKVTFHTCREEMSQNFALSLVEGVEAYAKVNGGKPDRLIIYRDGVSEGMIPYVFEEELGIIRKGIARASGEKNILMTFIVVTKRVNARFFAVKENQYDNPPPGTVIDRVVTRKERYDFYLISQAVTEGTVAPTMFDIIHDDSSWNPSNHQKLAYKMTHLYYNWTGTVKVPAPCQYAHKLAFLCGQSLHTEFNKRLAHSLFYL